MQNFTGFRLSKNLLEEQDSYSNDFSSFTDDDFMTIKQPCVTKPLNFKLKGSVKNVLNSSSSDLNGSKSDCASSDAAAKTPTRHHLSNE